MAPRARERATASRTDAGKAVAGWRQDGDGPRPESGRCRTHRTSRARDESKRTDARLQASAATFGSVGGPGKSGIDRTVCSSAPHRHTAAGSDIRGKECRGSERQAGGCSSEASHGREFPGGTSRGRVNNHARRDLTAQEPARSARLRTQPCSTECPRPSALTGDRPDTPTTRRRGLPPPSSCLAATLRPATHRAAYFFPRFAASAALSTRSATRPSAPAAHAPPLRRWASGAGHPWPTPSPSMSTRSR